MATVTVVTAERTLEIEASSITSGDINAEGHLVLIQHDGTEIDVGAVSGMRLYDGDSYEAVDAFSYIGPEDPGAVANGSVWYDTDEVAGPFASESQKGLVELATTAETTTGTDTTRAVTAAGVKAVADTKQPTDSDLTAFAALSPANDDIVQRKAGAWTNRTMAQLLTDVKALPLAGGVLNAGAAIQWVSANTSQTTQSLMISGEAFNRYIQWSDGFQQWGSGSNSVDVSLYRSAANTLNVLTADVRIESPGRTLRIGEGTNAKMGLAVLVAGTKVVATTAVTANSRIFLTTNVSAGTPGWIRVSARTAGTSFTILSSSATDTSSVAWVIFEPA